MTKYSAVIFLSLCVVSLFSVLVPSASAHPDVYWVSLDISDLYGVRGDTIDITTTTNYTGYLLQIYLPNNQLYYNQTHAANTTIPFTIPINAPYGTYTVKSLIPSSETTTWFTVLDITNWDVVTKWPYVVSHNGVDYSFNANWTVTASNGEDSLTVDFELLKFLKNTYTLDVIPRNNSMNFLVRFTKESLGIVVDLDFAFIHSGVKIILNGTMDQARTCTFNITNTQQLRKVLNGVKQGHLVFDWSDVKKVGQAFTYSNGLLNVSIPQTFRVDPTIFEDGFETGTTENFDGEQESGGTFNVISDPVYEGSYSGQALSDGNAGSKNIQVYKDSGSVSSGEWRYVQAVVNFSYFPASGYGMMIGVFTGATSGDGVQLGLRDSGYFSIRGYWDSAWQNQDGDEMPSVDTWYIMELGIYRHATDGNILGYLDGELDINITGVNTDYDFRYLRVGMVHFDCPASIETVYCDNVICDDVYIGVEAANTAPVNDVCTITDMDDSNNLYAQISGGYTLHYDGHDVDGYADMTYIFVNMSQGPTVRAAFRYDEDGDSFSLVAGSTEFTLDGSSSASKSGTTINLTIVFHVQWDATEESGLELNCSIGDDEPTSDTDTLQTDYCDVVTNLLTSSIECTDANDPDRVDISSSITIDFSTRYANNPSSASATTFYPPDAEYTNVTVFDDESTVLGLDTSIVNGEGSVTGTSHATVRQTYYNLYINMVDADYTDGEETPTEEVITDQLDITSIADDTGDQRIDVSSTFELRYQIEYDYDDVTFDDGKGSISGYVWDSINSWWDKTETGSSSVTLTNYDETDISMTDSTYGLTGKKDVAGLDVITDRILLLTLGANDTRTDINSAVEIYATAELEYDSHALGSGDSLTIEGLALSWNVDHFNNSETKTSVQQKTYNEGTGSEVTYGITVVNVDGLSVSVVWDRLQISFSVDDETPNNNETVTFTVVITREYDSSSVSSYLYDVNRNDTLFIDDRSTPTFTDVNNTITFVYDIVYVVDQTYNLYVYVDPNNITVVWAFYEEYEVRVYIDICRTTLGTQSETDYGYAVNFSRDGSDYIDVTDTGGLGTNEVYVCAWVWSDNFNYSSEATHGQQIVADFPHRVFVRHDCRQVGGVGQRLLGFVYWDGGNSYSTEDYVFNQNNTWLLIGYGFNGTHHFIVRNDTIMDIYDWGQQYLLNTSRPCFIGASTSLSYGFGGYIDELLVFNRVPNQTELTYLYNNGVGVHTPLDTSGLCMWYHFNEGTGTITYDSGTEGTNGTFNGSPQWVTGHVPLALGLYPNTITISNVAPDFTVKLYNDSTLVCEAQANSSGIVVLTLPYGYRSASFEGTYRVYSPDNTFIYSKWFEGIKGGDTYKMVEAVTKGFLLAGIFLLVFGGTFLIVLIKRRY